MEAHEVLGADEETPLLRDQMLADEADSPLDTFAKKHQEIAANREVNIPVPGYDKDPPRLLIRYRLLDGQEIGRMGEKIRRETKDNWQRQILAAVDTFIAANIGFYYDLGDGLLKPLTVRGEHLTRFDLDLANAFKFRGELPEDDHQVTARQVCLALFNHNDARIALHNYLLNRWFSDTTIDVEAELLGNL